MTSGPSEILGMAIALDRVPAVVTVAGDLDLSTAPTLRDLLEVLVEDGCTDIVLDLSALGFFDASGIRVLEHVMSLLLPRQGRLTLRSVPAQVRRVLDITGFSALIGIEPPESPLPARRTPHLVVSLTDAADAPEVDWTDRMRPSLLSRQQIARAQGVLMVREHVSADVADAILARASRSSRQSFLDQAIEVVGFAEHRRPSILIVEDDTSILGLVETLLGRGSLQATQTTTSAEAALALLVARNFDVVVLDDRLDGPTRGVDILGTG